MKPDPNEFPGQDQASRVAYLVAGYLRQTLTQKEHDELDDWITDSDENLQLFEELIDPKHLEKGLKEYEQYDTEAALKRIKSKIHFPKKDISKKQKTGMIVRWSIAASILLLIGVVIFFLMNQRKDKPAIAEQRKQDIQAGGNHAMLTLATGETIDLSTVRNGLIASSDGPDVLKMADGQLSYEAGDVSRPGQGSHVLTTPAGGTYSVTLPDGSRVWLNSESKLTYPVVFDAKERIVELEGEAYFEVNPSSSPKGESASVNPTELPRPDGHPLKRGMIPFIVKLRNNTEIEVKGTHFNVNAYEDENGIRATLLEGKIVLRGYNKERTQGFGNELMPGMQGHIIQASPTTNKGPVIRIINDVDTSAVVAWKNGSFSFKDAPIDVIMRQVARWYGAEIEYQGKVDYHFNATIYRTENVSKLLEVLEETGRVKFRVEGRKIVVRP